MPDTPSITINKDFTYRGKREVWSNTYHFSGTTPANDADWLTLALAIWNAEKGALMSNVKFAGYLGYAAGNNHAVSIKDYVADGTTQPAGALGTSVGNAPGDVAVWVRWRLPTRNSRGKWNYLRKYFHGVPVFTDQVGPEAVTALTAYAGKMTDGTLPGGAKLCGAQGEVAGVSKIAPFASYRELKRSGKRPSS